MKTIVLVHGAWADASAWDNTSPLLKAQGYDVIEGASLSRIRKRTQTK